MWKGGGGVMDMLVSNLCLLLKVDMDMLVSGRVCLKHFEHHDRILNFMFAVKMHHHLTEQGNL